MMATRMAALFLFTTCALGMQSFSILLARQSTNSTENCTEETADKCSGEYTDDVCINTVCGTACLTELPQLSTCCQGNPDLQSLLNCIDNLNDGSTPSLISGAASQTASASEGLSSILQSVSVPASSGTITSGVITPSSISSSIASSTPSTHGLTQAFTPSSASMPAATVTITATQSAGAYKSEVRSADIAGSLAAVIAWIWTCL